MDLFGGHHIEFMYSVIMVIILIMPGRRERERVELIKINIVGVVFLALFQQRTTAIVNNGVSK